MSARRAIRSDQMEPARKSRSILAVGSISIRTPHNFPRSRASAAGPYNPVQSIQSAIKNKHQCLVAEINLDPPEPQIATGTSPAVSDKLAQRNLNIMGVASPHLVPGTFDIKLGSLFHEGGDPARKKRVGSD